MTMRKILSFVLIAALCLGLMTTVAFAAEAEKDGLKLTLTTDKASYTADEQIHATLKVENTSDAPLSALAMTLTAPEGLRLSVGSATKNLEALAAGASDTMEVTYVVDANPDNGDSTKVLLLLGGIAMAAAAIFCLMTGRKRACLVLVAVLALGLAAMPAVQAAQTAAEVTATVQVDGKTVTLKASVTATQEAAPVDPPVVGPEYEDVTSAPDFEAAIAFAGASGTKITEDLVQGKFTFKAGCYFENTNTKYFESGNVNTQKKDIIITLQGITNSIRFDARGASGSGCVLSLHKEGVEEAIYTSENIESGTLVEAIEIKDLEPGVYTLKSSGSCRIGDFTVTERLEKSEAVAIEVKAGNNKFLLGRQLSADTILVELVYSNGRRDVLQAAAYTTDIADVPAVSGKHTVTVTHTATGFRATYEVILYAIDSIAVSDYSLDSGRVTHAVQKIYLAGSSYDNYDHAAVIATCSAAGVEGTESFVLKEGEYTFTPATQNDPQITVTAAGKTASYAVEILSLSDKVNRNHIIVDANGTVGEGSDGVITVKNLNDAIRLFQLLESPADDRKIITIYPGIYREKVDISIPNLSIVAADGAKAEEIVIVHDALNGLTDPSGTTGYSTDGSATFSLRKEAEGFFGKGFTIMNYYNTHALYEQSKLVAGSGTQAVACLVRADKVIFEGMRFSSYHDTLYAENGRHIYRDCYIAGRTDYIFGNDATCYFTGCTIRSLGAGVNEKNGGYVVATKGGSSSAHVQYGYIFDGCIFEGDENVQPGSVSIARGWDKYMTVMVMNSQLDDSFSLEPHGYTASNLNDRYTKMNADPVDVQLFEYNNTGAGALTAEIIASAVEGVIENLCSIPTEQQAKNYADFSLIFADVNGTVKYSESWSGSLGAAAITLYHGNQVLGTLNVYQGDKVTMEQLEQAARDQLPEGKSIGKVYTDSEGKNAYDFAPLTGDIALYVTLVDTDPTVKESVSYGVDDYQLVSAGESLTIGKLQINGGQGEFAPNGDWFRLKKDASITLKLLKGSSVTLLMYDKALAINGVDIAEDAYVGTNGALTYTYTADKDGDVVITKASGANQLYVKTISVNVPVVYRENTTIVLNDYAGATVQGGIGEYKGITIDATNGKFAVNNADWIQINQGTVLKLYVAEGAQVTAKFYNENTAEAAYYEIRVEDGAATITVLGNTYIQSITVAVPMIYRENTTIAISDYAGDKIEGSTGEYKGIAIDATNGKFAANNADWLQINAGTVLKLYVAEGAQVTAKFYNENTAEAAYYEIRVEGGVATITVLGNTYIQSITVTVA